VDNELNAQLASLPEYLNAIIALAVTWVPKVLLTLLTLIIGLWIIKRIVGSLQSNLAKREVDPTLSRFMSSMANIALKVMLIISVASMVGIETTSFVAVLGASGLAIGLALQGSLANFAGGVLVLFFKPYRVGDFIEAQGVTGTVKAIEIFNTILTTPDNRVIIVPNAMLSNGIITNFSAEKTRRLDFVFGIAYSDDIKLAKTVLSALTQEDARILKDPEPLIVVGSLGDNSVNFTVRVWVNAADYWGVHFDMVENVKLRFDEAGLSIPFPQRDVHLYNHS